MKNRLKRSLINSYFFKLPTPKLMNDIKNNLVFSSTKSREIISNPRQLRRGMVSILLSTDALFSLFLGMNILLGVGREASIERVFVYVGVAFVLNSILSIVILGFVLKRYNK
jgi:hypothetical protein